MTVGERRQQRLAVKIDYLPATARYHCVELLVVAPGEDAAVDGGYGRDLGATLVHGVNVAVQE
jgi:hypothetical protein